MGIIQVMDDQLANQIAAGEVVERPASVVKELVENAIDAKATRIDVQVEEGGLQLIQVKDNGSGLEFDDIQLAFERHATSKIRTNRDLFSIRSLGFRGEALPSIAAVAKVEVITSPDQSGLGRRLVMEGGRTTVEEDAQSMQGTVISVRDLFFNTPARLKYMKSIPTELGHISDYLYRMALAYPAVGFTLKHNGNVLIQTLGNGDLLQVIAAVYGVHTAKQMVRIEAEHLDYQISGYVGKPELTRSNRNAMSWFINGRYVRSFSLNQALMRAYHTLLPINRYPMIVMEVNMHPTLVDVNVHPAKMEVRFSKEAELVELIEATVREKLAGQPLIPLAQAPKAKVRTMIEQVRMDWTATIGNEGESSSSMGGLTAPHDPSVPANSVSMTADVRRDPAHVEIPLPIEPPPDRQSSSHASHGYALHEVPPHEGSPYEDQRRSVEGTERERPDRSVPSDAVKASYTVKEARSSWGERQQSVRPQSSTVRPNVTAARTEQVAPLLVPKEETSLPPFPALSYVGQHHGTYLICSNESGLYVMDQHAAHERINYERFREQFAKPADASQELLLPITMEMTPNEVSRIQSRLPLLEQVGIVLEPFGQHTFLIRSHPYWLPSGDEEAIIREMVDWVLEEKAPDIGTLREAAAIMCSCKASIKANQRITEVEATTLIARLAACHQPYTCPHGRPIVVSFSTTELEKMFKRIM